MTKCKQSSTCLLIPIFSSVFISMQQVGPSNLLSVAFAHYVQSIKTELNFGHRSVAPRAILCVLVHPLQFTCHLPRLRLSGQVSLAAHIVQREILQLYIVTLSQNVLSEANHFANSAEPHGVMCNPPSVSAWHYGHAGCSVCCFFKALKYVGK